MIKNRKHDICVLFLSLHVPVEGAARDEKIMHGNGNVVPFESFNFIQSSIVMILLFFGIICVVKT